MNPFCAISRAGLSGARRECGGGGRVRTTGESTSAVGGRGGKEGPFNDDGTLPLFKLGHKQTNCETLACQTLFLRYLGWGANAAVSTSALRRRSAGSSFRPFLRQVQPQPDRRQEVSPALGQMVDEASLLTSSFFGWVADTRSDSSGCRTDDLLNSVPLPPPAPPPVPSIGIDTLSEASGSIRTCYLVPLSAPSLVGPSCQLASSPTGRCLWTVPDARPTVQTPEPLHRPRASTRTCSDRKSHSRENVDHVRLVRAAFRCVDVVPLTVCVRKVSR